jgi:hypothetical protein
MSLIVSCPRLSALDVLEQAYHLAYMGVYEDRRSCWSDMPFAVIRVMLESATGGL